MDLGIFLIIFPEKKRKTNQEGSKSCTKVEEIGEFGKDRENDFNLTCDGSLFINKWKFIFSHNKQTLA